MLRSEAIKSEIERLKEKYTEALAAEMVEEIPEVYVEPEPVIPEWLTYHENIQKDDPIKVGDIFYSSWGYGQTNITFYQIVSITKSGKSCKIVEINSIATSTGDMTGTKMPDPSVKSSDQRLKRLKDIGGTYGVCLRMSSYEYAYRWNGKKKSFSSYH